jgi:predicted O-methyltransferase YrrM
MKEADGARGLWAKLLKDLGNVAYDLSAMHRHHLYPHGPSLIDVLEARGRRWGTILEIGTAHGAGTAMLSYFADRVVTIDVKRWAEVEAVMGAAGPGVQGHIDFRVVADNAEKKAVVEALDFDLAFIDGDHHAAEFKIDFDLCKRCGVLLCHDYPTWRPGVAGPGAVLDAQTEGTLEPYPPFVWWAKR